MIQPAEVSQECRTGDDANERQDCRIVAVVNSVQGFWDGEFERSGQNYTTRTPLLHRPGRDGCGFASAQVGPFYCPRDQQVYIDLGFFDELQSALRRWRRDLRAGVRHRPRVRPPRPGPARCARMQIGGDRRSGEPRRTLRAAGRLLRRRLGAPTPSSTGTDRRSSRRRHHRGARRRQPPSATTASRNARRARSTPKPGRTAHPNSADAGSRPATSKATQPPATPSAATSRSCQTVATCLGFATVCQGQSFEAWSAGRVGLRPFSRLTKALKDANVLPSRASTATTGPGIGQQARAGRTSAHDIQRDPAHPAPLALRPGLARLGGIG